MITTGSVRGWCCVPHRGQRRTMPPSEISVGAPQTAQWRWRRCQFTSAAACAASPPSAWGREAAAARRPNGRVPVAGSSGPSPWAATGGRGMRAAAYSSAANSGPAACSSTPNTGPSASRPSRSGSAARSVTSGSSATRGSPPGIVTRTPSSPTTTARASGLAACAATQARSVRRSAARSSRSPVKVIASAIIPGSCRPSSVRCGPVTSSSPMSARRPARSTSGGSARVASWSPGRGATCCSTRTCPTRSHASTPAPTSPTSG